MVNPRYCILLDESREIPSLPHMEIHMPITEELLVEFLIEHEIEDAEELEIFSEMVHLLLAEPNIPLIVIN